MVQTWERIQMCILETKVNGKKKGCSESDIFIHLKYLTMVERNKAQGFRQIV